MRVFQIGSQNWVWVIFDPYIDPKKRQIGPELWFIRFFCYFSAKIVVKYYPNPILGPYLESPQQDESFRFPIWKRDRKLIFGSLDYFQNFISSVRTEKLLLGGGRVKLSYVVAHLQEQGISSENMEKVSSVEIWNSQNCSAGLAGATGPRRCRDMKLNISCSGKYRQPKQAGSHSEWCGVSNRACFDVAHRGAPLNCLHLFRILLNHFSVCHCCIKLHFLKYLIGLYDNFCLLPPS